MTTTHLLFDRIDEPGLNTLQGYEKRGGYSALRKAFAIPQAAIVEEISASGLRGRGGAGFKMGQKASFLPKGEMAKYLVCNADESEPGTFKDRELMQKCPHVLIEGMIITTFATGINHAFIYIRGEYELQADILEAAIAEAEAAGFIGENILGSGHSLKLVLHRGAGAYICGEETGLLDSLEGKRGNPRLKPPFPAIEGLYHGPTLVNNVETLATVPTIINMGGAEYAKIGTEGSTGTKLISVSGDVQRPGNYEIVLGTSSREIIFGLCGGPKPGRTVKMWFPGGSSSPVLLEEDLDLAYDFDTHTSPAASAYRAAKAPTGRIRCWRGSSRVRPLRWTSTSSHRYKLRSSATACASSVTRWRCRWDRSWRSSVTSLKPRLKRRASAPTRCPWRRSRTQFPSARTSVPAGSTEHPCQDQNRQSSS